MNCCVINPYIRRAKRSIIKFHHDVKKRIILDYELIYIESGTLLFHYNGVDYLCPPGSLVFIRPGIEHSFDTVDGDISQPHIHFDMSYDVMSPFVPITFQIYAELSAPYQKLLRTDVFAEFPQNPLLKISDMQSFLDLFFSIVDNPKRLDNGFAVKSEMLQLIDMIQRENFPGCLEEEAPQLDLSRELQAFLASKLTTPVTLDAIEKQFNYSKFYLERKFSSDYGISIMSYYRSLRMNHARELLKTKTVTEVCEEMNFGSVYAFSRSFKAYFGVAPSKV